MCVAFKGLAPLANVG